MNYLNFSNLLSEASINGHILRAVDYCDTALILESNKLKLLLRKFVVTKELIDICGILE
jgi:hypothetical protein